MLASRASWMVFGLILVFLATISLLLLPVSIAALEPTPDPCGETGPLAPTFQPPTNMPGVSPTWAGGSNGTVTPAESAVHPCATRLPPSDTVTLAPKQVLSTLIGSPGTRMPLVRSSPSLTRSPTRSKTPTATVTPSTTPTSGQVRALTTGCASTTRWTATYDFTLNAYSDADTFIEGWKRRVPSQEGKYTNEVGWQVDLEQGTGRVVLQANLKRAVHIIHISAVLDYRPAGEGFHQAAFYVPPQMPAIAAAWATGGVFTLHWSGDRTDISQLEVNIWAGTGTATIHSVTIDGYGEMLDGTCPPPVSNCPGAWQRTYDFGASDGGWVTRDVNEGSYQAGVGWQTANVGTQRVVIEHAVRADKITRVTAVVDYNPGGGDFQQAIVYVPDYGSTSNSATRLVSATTTGNGLNLTWPATGIDSRTDITVLQINIWAGPTGSATIRSITIAGVGRDVDGVCELPICTSSIQLASANPTSGTANSYSESPSISGGGRNITFKSFASNLLSGTPIPAGTVQPPFIFKRDMLTPGMTLVSADANGTPAAVNTPTGTPGPLGGGYSDHPSLSIDGRYVVFESDANNLVANDNNNRTDIFAKDTVTGAIVMVSRGLSGVSSHPVISPDAKYVTWEYLDPSSGSYPQIYARDISGFSTLGSLIAVTSGNNASTSPTISGQNSSGHYIVAFASSATNLLGSTALNGYPHIYWRDLQDTSNTLHSIPGAGGAEMNEAAASPAISADGRWIAFESFATNTSATAISPTLRRVYLYAYDLQNAPQPPVMVSVADSGDAADSSAYDPVIAGPDQNGNYLVAFWSNATNLGISNGHANVFIRNITTGKTKVVSVGSTDNSYSPGISSDGACVAFYSANNYPSWTTPHPNVFSVQVSTPMPTATSTTTPTATP